MAEHQAKTEAQCRAVADLVIHRALNLMIEEGVPFDMMIDRVLTSAAAQIAVNDGAAKTADVFRALAANIDAGALNGLKFPQATQLQ